MCFRGETVRQKDEMSKSAGGRGVQQLVEIVWGGGDKLRLREVNKLKMLKLSVIEREGRAGVWKCVVTRIGRQTGWRADAAWWVFR